MPIQLKDLMTPTQIQKCAVQPEVIKEAYGQVEKRLSDMLETKKSFEQRASWLLTSFSALALALLGAGGMFFTSQPLVGRGPSGLPYAFFVASIPMIVAMWRMVSALKPLPAGNLGSTPDFWLRPGVIDAAANVAPVVQAYVVYYMAERINATEEANALRENCILWGCWCAFATPVVLAVGIVVAISPRLSGWVAWALSALPI